MWIECIECETSSWYNGIPEAKEAGWKSIEKQPENVQSTGLCWNHKEEEGEE